MTSPEKRYSAHPAIKPKAVPTSAYFQNLLTAVRTGQLKNASRQNSGGYNLRIYPFGLCATADARLPTAESLPAGLVPPFPGTQCNGGSKARLPGAWR